MSFESFKFKLGIESIDKQHYQLFEFINNLKKLDDKEFSDNVVIKILNEILFFTQNHFSHEESLFRKYNYSLTEDHTKKHKKLMAELIDIIENIKRGGVVGIRQLLISILEA